MPYEDLDYDEYTDGDRLFEWILGLTMAALVVFIGAMLFLC